MRIIEVLKQLAELTPLVGVIAAATLFVFHLGRERQRIQDANRGLAGDLGRLGEQITRLAEQVESMSASIQRLIAAQTEQRVADERWRARFDARVSAMEGRLDRLERVEERQAA